jgi:hypothetical protein
MHGHIVGALNAACMNPVLFFDELDKVSEPQGEEVVTVSYISPTAPRITGFRTDTSALIWTCPGGHDSRSTIATG